MSKPLSSYHGKDRDAAIARRIASRTMGLGYLSAMEAAAIHKDLSKKQLDKALAEFHNRQVAARG